MQTMSNVHAGYSMRIHKELNAVNGGVVHGRGFESLTFRGPLWCSAMVVGSNLCLFRG
jgi:hypothetical protein